jgi:tetratricopeptide (TPR) repeat protein
MAGINMSIAEYQSFIASVYKYEAFPESPEDLERYFAPASKRQLVAVLLTLSKGQSDQEFERDCNDAISLCPDFHLPLVALTGHFGKKNDLAKCEDLVTKAIALAPHHPELYSARGSIRTLQDKSAMEDIDRALRLAPHWPEYHFTRALLLEADGHTYEAISACTSAIEYAPRRTPFLFKRAELYGILKKHQEALADLNKAIEIDPQDAEAYSARAKTWAQIGDEQKYEADLNKAKELRAKK